MFDKMLFDRNAYDRSVSADNLTITMLASSAMTTRPRMRTELRFNAMVGSGALKPGVVSRQGLYFKMNGDSMLTNTQVVLRARLSGVMSSTSMFEPRPHVRTPFRGALTSSGGVKISNQMFLYLVMNGRLVSHGAFVDGLVLKVDLHPFAMTSTSSFKMSPALQLPLLLDMNGSGTFTLRRLGALNENTIELLGLNLMPGESVTIDTDLLQVLIGAKEDVSSVTEESVFFTLNPGENEITVSTDTNTSLDLVTIWQNRWL